MISPTAIHVFGWKIAGSLLLATIVAPAWGQHSEELVSSRKDYQPTVVTKSDPVQSPFSSASVEEVASALTFNATDTDIKAETTTARRGPLQPLEVSPKHETPSPHVESPKKLPKLADPEQYRAHSANSTDPWFKLQDKDQSAQQSSSQQKPAMVKKNSASQTQPTIDLRAAIIPDSMQQAVLHRSEEVPEPNLTFVANATFGPDHASPYQPFVKTWRSPDMLHRSLYFEDANLERCGNGIGFWQPVASGVRFFSSVAFLPYKSGKSPWRDCEYSLGHLRPGDCNPAYKHSRKLSPRGLIVQGLAIGTIWGGL